MSSGTSGSAALTTDANDPRPVETIRSVINSIYGSALNPERNVMLQNGLVAPCCSFSMYYASLLLISHGAGVLQDGEWLQKVEVFKTALEMTRTRWEIAGEFSARCRLWPVD